MAAREVSYFSLWAQLPARHVFPARSPPEAHPNIRSQLKSLESVSPQVLSLVKGSAHEIFAFARPKRVANKASKPGKSMPSLRPQLSLRVSTA